MSPRSHRLLALTFVVALAACRDKSADDASDDDTKPKKSSRKGDKIDSFLAPFASPPIPSASPSAATSATPSAAASASGLPSGRARSDALVEDYDFGTVAWSFGGDGSVRVDVKDADKAPITDPAKIDLKVGPPDAQTSVSLTTVDGSAQYSASIPAFTADLTPVAYTFDLKGKSYAGTLDVPVGGTKTIVAVDTSAPKVTIAADATAPHGGVLQVVGDDRIELVADQDTGEARVYVLDSELRPIEVGERRVTIGVVADSAEIVPFAVEPGGLYFTARWGIEIDPTRVTVGMRIGPVFHAAIFGWRPGLHLVAGASAPAFAVRVRTGWPVPARAFVHGRWVDWDRRWDHGDLRRGDHPHVGDRHEHEHPGIADRDRGGHDHEAHPHPIVAPPGRHEGGGKPGGGEGGKKGKR